MASHMGDSAGFSKNFGSRPPKLSWGAVIVWLMMILAIVGMGIYQKYK